MYIYVYLLCLRLLRAERFVRDPSGSHGRCVGTVNTRLQDAAFVVLSGRDCSVVEPREQIASAQHIHRG